MFLSLGTIVVGVAICAIAIYYQQKARRLEQKVIVAARDRRAVSTEYQVANQLRDALMGAISDGVLILDDAQRIRFVNPPAEVFLGDHLIGETLIAATRHYELDTLVQNMSSGAMPTHEKRVELDHYLIRAQVHKVETSDGAMTILILRDETELRRLGRARQEMVANISHELRTPITTISLLVDTLLNGALDKSKRARRMVKDIQRETATLAQLVQEMRDLSLIESGQMPVKLTPTAADEMVRQSIEPLTSLAEDKNISLQIELPEGIMILADSGQMSRVLRNIFHNAVKFTPENGSIVVRVDPPSNDEDMVTFSIKDSGTGILPENLTRIFERFFQENLARTDGTGLGLAIARHIVRAHGGQIWVESVTGQGATFFFTVSPVSMTITE